MCQIFHRIHFFGVCLRFRFNWVFCVFLASLPGSLLAWFVWTEWPLLVGCLLPIPRNSCAESKEGSGTPTLARPWSFHPAPSSQFLSFKKLTTRQWQLGRAAGTPSIMLPRQGVPKATVVPAHE